SDLQILDQRVAEARTIPEKLVITAERSHGAGDVIGDDIGRGRGRNGLVRIAHPHIQLLLPTPLGFGGLGAELGCHVVIRAGDTDIADPVDKILVAVGIRLPDHQVTLNAMPARLAAKTPHEGFFDLQNTARLHVVVNREGIDLVIGRVRLAPGDENPGQSRHHHQEEGDYGPSESARNLHSALANGCTELHHCFIVLDCGKPEPGRPRALTLEQQWSGACRTRACRWPAQSRPWRTHLRSRATTAPRSYQSWPVRARSWRPRDD